MKASTAPSLAVVLALCLHVPVQAYTLFSGRSPGGGPVPAVLDQKVHDVNDVYMMVSNRGPLALNLETGTSRCFFPSGTGNRYVFGAGLWFGAKFDMDQNGTIDRVFTQAYNPLAGDSEFREGRPDQELIDPLTRVFDSRVPLDINEWPEPFRDPDTGEPVAWSDQDLVASYTTEDAPPVFGTFQLPLDVNQRSMAFTGPDSVDQVIYYVFDITNRSTSVLKNAWIGFVVDTDIEGNDFDDDQVSVVFDRVTPAGDTIRLDMGYAWDGDFAEVGFEGTPGFVGVSLLLSPGNSNDGIDNDGDGLVDEAPDNGIDDDADGMVDEWDEVDEIGLVNFSKICNPSVPCELNGPETDSTGYDLLACSTPGSAVPCLESTTPADVRFMISSGPFHWLPGQKQIFAVAFVFAHSVGEPESLAFVGDPPRPDPNDPALAEFVAVAARARAFFPTLVPTVGIGGGPGGTPEAPRAFVLLQNFPNPFNPTTTIGFEIARGAASPVDLGIFDVRGRRVRTLVSGRRPPGRYEVQWDGRDARNRPLPSGSYLYRLVSDDLVSTRRMSLAK
jgi:hypothetical protein